MTYQRKEVIGDCTLYLGDCLEIMPGLGAVDAVVTDPPYSSGGFTQSAISKAKGQGLRSETIKREGWFSGDAMTAAGGAYLLREVARLAFDLTDTKATLTAFTDWRVAALYAPAIESARWRYQNMLVWDKGSAGLGAGFRAQHELALHFSKGAPEYHAATYGNVLKAQRVPSKIREHQCEKPLPLLSQIIETVTGSGEVVLDAFMGAGSTGAACVALGRAFVGIEVDAGYFETACRRVEEAYKQPRLLNAPASEPHQGRILFDGAEGGT